MIYYLRLDDACEKRDISKWNQMEDLLDRYEIKPLVGIIPHCEDPMMDRYDFDSCFWDMVDSWIKKGWIIAMHGYSHVFETDEGGINPVNNRSEFAGVDLEIQRKKIKDGLDIFKIHGIKPVVFFAPAHTFDLNTIRAIKEESNIRIISDTVANKPYRKWDLTFIPQQSGHVRKLPLSVVTFCYHPNTMSEIDFVFLEEFIKKNREKFKSFQAQETNRKNSLIDIILRFLYFVRRQ